jgi:hypothetical protein
MKFEEIWIQQCDAAEGIKEELGKEKALGYLVGEKLLNFMKVADRRAEWAKELPKFIARIREIFEEWEVREYFDNVKRVGALGHICEDDEQYNYLQRVGMIKEDVVKAAENVVLVERAKDMLLA